MSDLTLPLIGLTTLVGYFFSKDGKTNREVEVTRQKIEPFDKPNGKNIYTSNVVNEANDEILKRSLENYKLAENPSDSGFIPPLYNTYSAVGNESMLSAVLNSDPKLGLSSEQLGKLNDINRLGTEIKNDVATKPMFKPLGKYLGKEESINYSEVAGVSGNQEINHLTGLPFKSDHNNMVPFFGGSMKQNIETFSNESLLENRSGKSATFSHKKEINSLYDKKPENIYGNPVFTTQVETDRYVPSLYRQNEKPAEQAYISAPIAGTLENPLNPRMLAKTVDELRVLTNQKETFKARTIAGQFGNVRGIQAEVEKRRPDTYYEQTTPDNLFRGPGAHVGPMGDKNYETNFKGSSRQDYNMEYYGVANNSQINKTKQRLGTIDNSSELELSLFQDPKRQNFKNDYIRNMAGDINDNKVNDYGRSGIIAYESERVTTGDKSQLLNAQKTEFGMSIRPQDNAKSTLKETTLTYDNSGNIKTSFDKGKISAYNIGLLNVDAKTTQKQSLIDNKYIGQSEQENGMGYLVTKFDAKTTGKELITNKGDYVSNGGKVVKNAIIHSTYENPEKVRTVAHVDYKGNAKFNTESESRQKYSNVDIRDNKQEILMGQRPSGPQFFQTSSGKVSQADIKTTENMLLKERNDDREKMNVNTSQVIPTKESIGMIVKYREDNGPEDTVTSSRLDPTILNQLSENPFVINTNKQ